MSLDSYLNPGDSLILTGNFGSGKTELALNIAFSAAEENYDVALTDLDVINPYFRSRQMEDELKEAGIDIIFPERVKDADLPVISPNLKRALREDDTLAIFDAGGDEEGAVALSSVAGLIDERKYEKWLVVNPLRPRTGTVDKIIATAGRISRRSGLEFTGVVANIHLGQETDADIIYDNFPAVREAAAELELDVKFLAVAGELQGDIENDEFPCPLFPLKLYLNPPGKIIDSG